MGVADGGRVVVATLPSGATLAVMACDNGVRPSDVSFRNALDVKEMLSQVREFATLAADALKDLQPDEIEVGFSVGVTASAGGWTTLIVDGGASATFDVRLTWRSDQGTETTA